MGRKGMPYSRNQGHIRMAANMDSTLYYRDYKTYRVPVHAGTPVLIGEDLAQVVLLLREALLHVYGMDVPVVALSDTFHHNLRVRTFLTTRNPIKKMVAGWVETRVLGPTGRNAIRGRMQPAPPLERLPTNWSNPFDGVTHNLTMEEIMVEAEEAGALFISAAMRLWLGEAEVDELAAMLGSLDYYTGQPEGAVAIEKSDVPYFISK